MRVIGLMSGTSVDGIDAAVVEITGDPARPQVTLLAGETYDYPADLRAQILAVCGGAALSMQQLAQLDEAIAQAFAQAALKIAQDHRPITLIGSHGQTVFHRPPTDQLGYTMQLGRGDLIAAVTGVETVSNFRVADIALGGHGAPLVPPVDVALLSHPTDDRAVQNIGGIGNVAFLPATNRTETFAGFDTGPGNVLLDLAVAHLSQGEKTYDADGAWASQGQIHPNLVQQWLAHPYFQQTPPKSTGRELFGVDYFQQCLADAAGLPAADLLACLTELTVLSIVQSYQQWLPRLPQQVLLCGGGSHNGYLRSRLQQHLPTTRVLTTTAVGLDADSKEAIAFAVLAYWRKHGIYGNLPQVTGAREFALLGEIYGVAGNSAVIA
ncbi:anhydro-N-acetylmuramic acid kinase [filamentous cyanobacterium LEGE 11480]|uniref:Anhydro-N-acetylmuramic acid kinase n=1 Tax=Romeriopsis navalis LEGE 11480 TaxID=2777977 RepID=A0A928VKY7_9CYAN|nr:anhydro-N-acetylmuramic acid kinase [Romeriopsis navalis LEGE 11480]